jgi:hypothetical protein
LLLLGVGAKKNLCPENGQKSSAPARREEAIKADFIAYF